MSWELSAFGSPGVGILGYTPGLTTRVAVAAGATGLLVSDSWADTDAPVVAAQKGAPAFAARDIAFDNADACYVADGNVVAVHRCANIFTAPTTWTEVGYATSGAAGVARCVAPASSSVILVIESAGGLRRKAGGSWTHPLLPGTAFGSGTHPYRRCLHRFLSTPQVVLAYDPDIGVFKTVDFGATWFPFWTHVAPDPLVAMVCGGPSSSNAYLIDGATTYRLNGAGTADPSKTIDNAQLTATDCLKAATAACSDGRGDICVLVPQVGGTKKIFRSQTHTGTEVWDDEEDGNLAEFSPGLEHLAMSDDGYIYASDPAMGVIRGVFEGARITVDLTTDQAEVHGGQVATGTVTIFPAAPAEGTKVWIDSDDRDRAAPQTTLLFTQGETVKAFPIPVGILAGPVRITALSRPGSMDAPGIPNAAGTSFAALGLAGGIPIEELGLATYQGREGGLYGGGSNEIPSTNNYDARLVVAAAGITPRDAAGLVDLIAGKIGVASLGFSNPYHEWDDFTGTAPPPNPRVVTINGAQIGMDITDWAVPAPNAPQPAPAAPATGNAVWDTFISRVRAKCSDAQLQAVWMVQAVQGPQSEVPSQLVDDLEALMLPKLEIVRDYLQATFPNLKLLLVSDRTWGGYHALASPSGNPEPWAYQTGFVERAFILGSRDNAAKLPTTWGPKWWGNGVIPRADRTRWLLDEFWEGTHESASGLLHVGRFLERFFTTSALTGWWNA